MSQHHSLSDLHCARGERDDCGDCGGSTHGHRGRTNVHLPAVTSCPVLVAATKTPQPTRPTAQVRGALSPAIDPLLRRPQSRALVNNLSRPIKRTPRCPKTMRYARSTTSRRDPRFG